MPIVEKLGLTRQEEGLPSLPAIVYAGDYKGLELTVVFNGTHDVYGCACVGTAAAAVTVYAAIQKYAPDLVLNAGTAGGFAKKGAAIGDAYVVTGFANHDRRIPIPAFTEFAAGAVGGLPASQLVSSNGFKTGIVTTGNSLDYIAEDAAIMEANDATVKDMEAAAIAEVCRSCQTALLAIKVVTDIVDGDRPTQDEFLENLGAAAASLQRAVPEALDFIAGKKLNEL